MAGKTFGTRGEVSFRPDEIDLLETHQTSLSQIAAHAGAVAVEKCNDIRPKVPAQNCGFFSEISNDGDTIAFSCKKKFCPQLSEDASTRYNAVMEATEELSQDVININTHMLAISATLSDMIGKV